MIRSHFSLYGTASRSSCLKKQFTRKLYQRNPKGGCFRDEFQSKRVTLMCISPEVSMTASVTVRSSRWSMRVRTRKSVLKILKGGRLDFEENCSGMFRWKAVLRGDSAITNDLSSPQLSYFPGMFARYCSKSY